MLLGVILGVVIALLAVALAIAVFSVVHRRKLERAARRADEAAAAHARASLDDVDGVSVDLPPRRRPPLHALPTRPATPEEEAALRRARNSKKRARRELQQVK